MWILPETDIRDPAHSDDTVRVGVGERFGAALDCWSNQEESQRGSCYGHPAGPWTVVAEEPPSSP